MSTSVKVFASTDPGALVLSGTAGALSTLLKTYLVDGLGSGAVATLNVTAGVATATYSAGHPFAEGSVGEFAGATPTGLNGQKRILSVATNSVTFDATGIADGAATGSITSKLASAGWQQVFSATNITCLKPAVVEATGCVLRIDDTGAQTARIVGYEGMSAVSEGQGPLPTSAQMAGGVHWPKSNVSDASPRAWKIVASASALLFWCAPHAGFQGHGVLSFFGDLSPAKSGDAFACMLTGGAADVVSSASAVPGCLGYGHATSGGAMAFVARSHTAFGSAQVVKKTAAHNTAAGYSATAAYNGNALPFPNGPDNTLRLSKVEVMIPGVGIRGTVPGVLHTPQQLADAFASGDTVDGSGDYAGKTLMALRCGAPGAATAGAGTVFVDLTGPWEA